MTTSALTAGNSPRRDEVLACAHCGLDVPDSMLPAGRQGECSVPAPGGRADHLDGAPVFCCNGCRAVYRVLHEAGLERYYDIRSLDPDAGAQPASPRQASYAEFDDPSFVALHTRERDGMRSIELLLEGVHCAACVWLVERIPGVLDGVASVRLDLGRGLAEVVYDPQRVALSRLARTLDSFGYAPHPFRSADRASVRQKEDRNALIRIGVAGAVAGNTMLLAVALYAGAAQADPALASFFRWMSLALTAVSMLWPARTFFAGAIAGLRTRKLHMDMPISLALIGASLSGAWNTLQGSGEIYFDSITMLVFLLLVARYVQTRALRAASNASEILFSLTPSKARLVDDDSGTVREVPSETLVPGQVFEVLAGDSIPADGVIVRGVSRLDTSLLTGESRPVEVGEGAEVHAGASNVSARIFVRATATGDATRVGKLLRAVQEAQARRAPIVLLADRIASWFVGGVILAAAGAALLWSGHGGAIALERAIAMLVVTCPCGLALATPLALSHAVGRAARMGIFIKGGDTIESLSRVRRILLDKTGTLTLGRVSLSSFDGPPELLHSLASLEAESNHPLARAVAEACPSPASLATAVSETTGSGVEGIVEGRRIAAGTASFLESRGCEIPQQWRDRAREAAGQGRSPVLVAADGRVQGLALFGDALRPDAVEAVTSLRKMGLEVAVLSGDHPEAVQHVASQLSIPSGEALGGISPEGKLAAVEKSMRAGVQVAMIGDGVNDAAALAAARVGIAVRGGAEASLASADAFLTRAGLRPAVELFIGSRATMRVIRRNLAISLAYNLAGFSLALAGLVSPLLAAILMPASSLTVILSSVLSRPFPSRGRAESGSTASPPAQEVVPCP